jgi:hypothetical protein
MFPTSSFSVQAASWLFTSEANDEIETTMIISNALSLRGALSIVCSCAMALPAGSAELAADALYGRTTTVQLEAQPWQVHRSKTAELANGAAQKKPGAEKLFDVRMADFKQHTMDYTPVEIMEVLARVYVPKSGLTESTVNLMAMAASLGWYDALRYASPTGKTELTDKEEFFLMALLAEDKSGTPLATAWEALLKAKPDQARAWIAKGIAMAQVMIKDKSVRYDQRWPSAYGHERVACARSALGCVSTAALPEKDWPAAWVESSRTVIDFYAPQTAARK